MTRRELFGVMVAVGAGVVFGRQRYGYVDRDNCLAKTGVPAWRTFAALDGRVVRGALAADDVAGFVEVVARDVHGHGLIEGGRVKRQRLRGRVSFVFKPETE